MRDAGTEGLPIYELVPTLHGPLSLRVEGDLLVADQGSAAANDEIARQSDLAFRRASGNP